MEMTLLTWGTEYGKEDLPQDPVILVTKNEHIAAGTCYLEPLPSHHWQLRCNYCKYKARYHCDLCTGKDGVYVPVCGVIGGSLCIS